jgi:ppGpp synthetase/RelA/SpoT-type nucleotidyltranferase
MPRPEFTKAELKRIDDLVAHFEANKHQFEIIVNQLNVNITKAPSLSQYIHSVKGRVKDPSHLEDKLKRKLRAAKSEGIAFDITRDNLFFKITDLAGFRILHLYTRQMEGINKALIQLFEELQYPLVKGPEARTWDDEYREYFHEIGIETVPNKRLYTSVHYVLETSQRTKYTFELQVRTLAEELWGEVDHTINYPHESNLFTCREQIKVLARVTSSCTRLVDSIFRSHEEDK